MSTVELGPGVGSLAAVVGAAFLAVTAAAALLAWSPAPLRGENLRGREVPAVLGLALWFGVAGGGLAGAAISGEASTRAVSLATAATITVLAAAGLADDLAGPGPRGIGGHLRSLARGRATTGILKLAVGVAAAIVLALHLADDPVRIAGIAMLVALCTNLGNALDVVPGRALKWAGVALGAVVTVAWSRPSGPVLAATLGGVLALLAFDLRERGMLGDAGSNPLGYMVGLGLAVVLPTAWLLTAAAAALALQIAAETVTISRLIEAVPPVRWFDRLGRTI